MAIHPRETLYDYAPTSTDRCTEWHVNFADPGLFVAYGSGLFAQDEMQVAEHPVLGSVLEALHAMKEPTDTVVGNMATPVLIRGAERRIRIATDANAVEMRPNGLYGNRFSAASTEAIERATDPIEPPTITNLIAIAAPSAGSGEYTTDQIEHILITAYTGFRASVLESSASTGTAIHTGFWGCGAFGGNRVLMPLLQLIAARLAEVDRLVFYSVDAAGSADFGKAGQIFDRLIATSNALAPNRFSNPSLQTQPVASDQASVRQLLQQIAKLHFRWGFSDGN